MLVAVTDRVSPDEPAWGIREGPEYVYLPDGARVVHWVQRVFVIRGDEKAYYETDFGPVEKYSRVTPLIMPSFGDDTVAQLQEYADRNRRDDYWAKRSDEMRSESTLMRDIVEQELKLHELRNNRSSFGAYQTSQRNGFTKKANR